MMCFIFGSFSLGTIIAIRNPDYYVSPDENPAIRCHDPSDIVVIKRHFPILYNIQWLCKPIKTRLSNPKLKRFQLSPRQMVENESGIFTSTPDINNYQQTPNYSKPTAFTSANFIQTPPTSMERQNGRRSHGHRRTKMSSSKILKKRKIHSEFLQTYDLNNCIFIFGFIIFILYLCI